MEQLQELHLSGLRIHDLTPISRLKHLNHLYITSCHQLKSIAPLLTLNQLERLSIENCYNMEDLEQIGAMTQLKALRLIGDSTAPKRLKLLSLKPFQNLKQLKHLDLSTTSIADKSYEVLLELPALERFDTTSSIKASVVEDIKSKHMSLKAGFFVDWDYVNDRMYEGKDWNIWGKD